MVSRLQQRLFILRQLAVLARIKKDTILHQYYPKERRGSACRLRCRQVHKETDVNISQCELALNATQAAIVACHETGAFRVGPDSKQVIQGIIAGCEQLGAIIDFLLAHISVRLVLIAQLARSTQQRGPIPPIDGKR